MVGRAGGHQTGRRSGQVDRPIAVQVSAEGVAQSAGNKPQKPLKAPGPSLPSPVTSLFGLEGGKARLVTPRSRQFWRITLLAELTSILD